MSAVSAGMLVYRRGAAGLEVLVVHPGGPFFKKKDEGAWSIPKGLIDDDEDPLAAARRELAEELGQPCPEGPVLDLGEVQLKSKKRVLGFAVEGELKTEDFTSNLFEIEWPPRSGKRAQFPEVDRAGYFAPDVAKLKLNPAQAPFVDRLVHALREA